MFTLRPKIMDSQMTDAKTVQMKADIKGIGSTNNLPLMSDFNYEENMDHMAFEDQIKQSQGELFDSNQMIFPVNL